MSRDAQFYLARKNEEGKLDFFPRCFYLEDDLKKEEDSDKWTVIGKKRMPCAIMTRCESSMYDLDDVFQQADESDFTDEMKKAFMETTWEGEDYFDPSLMEISLEDLRKLSDDYIKRGYYLTNQIDEYEREGDSDVLLDHIGANEYANLCAKQIKQSVVENEWGEKYTKYGYEDYMYYAFPDYYCKEWIIHELKIIANAFVETLGFEYYNDQKVYILYNYK